MKKFFVLGSSLLVFGVCSAFAADEPFRPEAGKFPPLEKARTYRCELVFVDHANRRGSIHVQGSGTFFRNDPQPFAMLHVRAFLPPDPKTSSVLVLPVDSKKLEPKRGGDGKASEEKMTFDAATRIWRGRERLGIEEVIAEGAWPAEGKKSLGNIWKPTLDGVFTRLYRRR